VTVPQVTLLRFSRRVVFLIVDVRAVEYSRMFPS